MPADHEKQAIECRDDSDTVIIELQEAVADAPRFVGWHATGRAWMAVLRTTMRHHDESSFPPLSTGAPAMSHGSISPVNAKPTSICRQSLFFVSISGSGS